MLILLGERLARREELDFFLGRLISALDEKNYQFNPVTMIYLFPIVIYIPLQN